MLVHPIPIEKWLVVAADGVTLRRRRSPRRGVALDLFDELVSMPGLIAHPADLLCLLPADLPEPSTCAIARLARRGRLVTYDRSGPIADGS